MFFQVHVASIADPLGTANTDVMRGLESGRFLKKAAQKLSLRWAGGVETSTA